MTNKTLLGKHVPNNFDKQLLGPLLRRLRLDQIMATLVNHFCQFARRAGSYSSSSTCTPIKKFADGLGCLAGSDFARLVSAHPITNNVQAEIFVD
jgi:hypothetical protein